VKRFVSQGEMSVSFWPFFGPVNARSETPDPALALSSGASGRAGSCREKVAQKRT
jgi:hypothetical protein